MGFIDRISIGDSLQVNLTGTPTPNYECKENSCVVKFTTIILDIIINWNSWVSVYIFLYNE